MINPFTRERELIQPHLHVPPYSQYKYYYVWRIVVDTAFDTMPAEEMVLYVPCVIPVSYVDSLVLSYFDPLQGMVFYNLRNGQKAHLTINYKPTIYVILPLAYKEIAFFPKIRTFIFDSLPCMVLYNPRNGRKVHPTIGYKPIVYAISPDCRRIAFFQNTLKPDGYAIEIYVYDWGYKIDRILDKIR